MNIPKAIREQQEEILALVERSQFLMSRRVRLDGDRVDFTFVNEVTFLQRDTNALDVIFQIPDNCDFVALRLSLFPFFRFVTTDEAANGVAESSFRPCIFTHTAHAFNDLFSVDQAAVDCSIQISEAGCDVGRALQNTPVPVSLLNCAPINYRPAELALTSDEVSPRYYNGFSHGPGITFPTGYDLPRGSNLSCRISPSYASDRVDPDALNADVTEQNEYRVVVVLEGYKVIK